VTRAHRCSRVWEADAIDDGRLDGPARLSFQKHTQGCAICARELAALTELRDTMRRAAALSSTPLEHRRARAELLRKANARALSRRGERAAGPLRWLAVAVACGLVAILAIALLRRAPTSASASASPPSFDVDDIEGAKWSSEFVGAQVHARLESGIASFHVEHTRPGQRFLLRMPDGEIEVHGTRFRVEVRRGATSRVDVMEGVVTLHLHGAGERRLRAGDAWEASPARNGLSEDEAGVPNGEIGAAAAVESAATGNAPDAPSLAKTPDARQGAAQQDIFATGVAAFRSGNYRRAEQLFDRFLVEGTPRDPRSEDAWFMKAVARSRLGDTEGAARLARDYLQRFPEGLRRPEAAQIEAAGQGSGSK
jgi:hypothetical protein